MHVASHADIIVMPTFPRRAARMHACIAAAAAAAASAAR